MVKGCDLLDRDFASAWPVNRRAYDTVRTLADDIEYLVLRTCIGKALLSTTARGQDDKMD